MPNLTPFFAPRWGIVSVCIFYGILAKKVMDNIGEGTIEIQVDTVTSKENGFRLARSAGYQVSVEEKEGEFLLKLVKA